MHEAGHGLYEQRINPKYAYTPLEGGVSLGIHESLLAVKDAPDAWREKSKKLFGIAPNTDKEGVLQDVHWTYGAIGYFPSYALGNIYGAQFLHKMKQDIDFDGTVAKGDLKPIKDWLDKHIHTHGSLYYPKELLMKVTGEKINHKYFIDYLNKKYSQIYDL